MLLASLWVNKERQRTLLIVTNYETEPMDDLAVKLDLAQLGLKGKVYAEDAVTLEPVAIGEDGTMKLDLLPERYRLVKISGEPPRYRDEALGPNLVTGAPAEIKENWTSADIQLEPNATYVVKAQLKIDKPLGEGSANPNKDLFGMFHFAALQLAGEGIHGVNATHKLALCSIKGTDQFLPYRETDQYKRACVPQYWERTPGWLTVFVPFGTAAGATSGKVAVTFTDPGQAVVKEVTVQKVKP